MKIRDYILCLSSFVMAGCMEDLAPNDNKESYIEDISYDKQEYGQVFYYHW